eukprot:490116-Amphidinium_carterae.2
MIVCSEVAGPKFVIGYAHQHFFAVAEKRGSSPKACSSASSLISWAVAPQLLYSSVRPNAFKVLFVEGGAFRSPMIAGTNSHELAIWINQHVKFVRQRAREVRYDMVNVFAGDDRESLEADIQQVRFCPPSPWDGSGCDRLSNYDALSMRTSKMADVSPKSYVCSAMGYTPFSMGTSRCACFFSEKSVVSSCMGYTPNSDGTSKWCSSPSSRSTGLSTESHCGTPPALGQLCECGAGSWFASDIPNHASFSGASSSSATTEHLPHNAIGEGVDGKTVHIILNVRDLEKWTVLHCRAQQPRCIGRQHGDLDIFDSDTRGSLAPLVHQARCSLWSAAQYSWMQYRSCPASPWDGSQCDRISNYTGRSLRTSKMADVSPKSFISSAMGYTPSELGTSRLVDSPSVKSFVSSGMGYVPQSPGTSQCCTPASSSRSLPATLSSGCSVHDSVLPVPAGSPCSFAPLNGWVQGGGPKRRYPFADEIPDSHCVAGVG